MHRDKPSLVADVARITDSVQRHHQLVRTRSSLGIVHAHYWRALARAEHAQGVERVAAFEEVHRLIAIAAALRRRSDTLRAMERVAPPISERRHAAADARPARENAERTNAPPDMSDPYAPAHETSDPTGLAP